MIGYNLELQMLLKLDGDQSIDEKVLRIGVDYEFSTKGHNIYPLQVPIHLVDRNWSAVASVMVCEFTVGDGRTHGRYQVLRVYDEKTRQVISENI